MTIKDYALELNISESVVIKKLKELGFNYSNEDDVLDDDAIILLDNELMNEVSESSLDEELASKYEMEDRAEEAAQRYNINLDEPKENKVKFKKKDNKSNDNKEFLINKKNVYKHKEKLQSNKEGFFFS